MKGYLLMATLLIALVITHFAGQVDAPPHGDNPQWQAVEQGADPSRLLQASSAGNAETFCDTNSYRYGISIDGYRFVQQWESPLFAVDTGRAMLLLKQDGQGSLFTKLQPEAENLYIIQELARCQRSAAKPESTELHFVTLKD